MIKIQKIVGHSLQCQELLADLESGNVTHAYLFSGAKHLGKMSVARWFSLQLLSEGVPAEEKKKIQNQIERLVHPDILVIDQLWMEGICEDWDVIAKTSNVSQQHRAKKPAAKTDIISIDDVRVMQERLYETGTGRWRCCIIRSIERMQDPAANALLKILEEPPRGLVFLLTTQSQSALLPTIISRTRTLHFHRLPRSELSPLLSGTPEDDSQFILDLAQGAPGTVTTLRDNHEALRERRLLHTKARSFWKSRSLRERLVLLEPLHQRDEPARQFLLHLSIALREVLASVPPLYSQALTDLVRGLETNAHRQLLTQQFVLAIEEKTAVL